MERWSFRWLLSTLLYHFFNINYFIIHIIFFK